MRWEKQLSIGFCELYTDFLKFIRPTCDWAFSQVGLDHPINGLNYMKYEPDWSQTSQRVGSKKLTNRL